VIGFDNRPFTDVNHMREELVRRHNEVVTDDDIVYHLGDMSMKHNSVPYYLQRLRGVHILMSGNHDRCFRQPKYVDVYKEYGFAEVWFISLTGIVKMRNIILKDL
jgi:calcineurin-like phosphoesterase family protein